MEDNTNKKPQKWAQNLPQYTPPESVWEEIEKELGRKNKGTISLNSRLWWLAAAASVAVVLGVFGWLNLNQDNAETITHSEEKITKSLVVSESPETDRQHQQIEAYCTRQVRACEEPEFRILKNELDQLNAAHEQLKPVVETYNPDPELVAQFAQIETNRASVLKKLFDRI